MTIATSSREKTRRDWGGRLVILIPALWLTIFFLVPCLIVLKISLSQTMIAQPPYVPVLDLAAGCRRGGRLCKRSGRGSHNNGDHDKTGFHYCPRCDTRIR